MFVTDQVRCVTKLDTELAPLIKLLDTDQIGNSKHRIANWKLTGTSLLALASVATTSQLFYWLDWLGCDCSCGCGRKLRRDLLRQDGISAGAGSGAKGEARPGIPVVATSRWRGPSLPGVAD